MIRKLVPHRLRKLGEDKLPEQADARSQTRPARDWTPKKAPWAHVTKDRDEVGAVVLLHDCDMKEAWCLTTSRTDLTGAQAVPLYGKRITAEKTCRDQKDPHFGLGLARTRIKAPKGATASCWCARWKGH